MFKEICMKEPKYQTYKMSHRFINATARLGVINLCQMNWHARLTFPCVIKEPFNQNIVIMKKIIQNNSPLWFHKAFGFVIHVLRFALSLLNINMRKTTPNYKYFVVIFLLMWLQVISLQRIHHRTCRGYSNLNLMLLWMRFVSTWIMHSSGPICKILGRLISLIFKKQVPANDNYIPTHA